MAYYSGSANDLATLRAAILSACTDHGWSLSGNILSKGTQFLQILVESGYLTFLAGTGASAGAITGAAPNKVKIGNMGVTLLTYPLAYELFVFDLEVYVVVNFSVDAYQWAAWGLSTVGGLAGTGMWVGASGGDYVPSAPYDISISNLGGGANGRPSGALFWTTTLSGAANITSHLHHNLDGRGWDLANPSNPALAVGIEALVPLMTLLPSAWNSEAVLLPIRAYAIRPSSRCSLIADLENARYTRLDNYNPGQIIQLGADRWKVFPWLRKNMTVRNGGQSIVGHSGTLGWAIRYEGP